MGLQRLKFCLLGAISGMNFAYVGSLMTVYLNEIYSSVILIGLLSFRMLTYSFKPLYAPLIDIFELSFIKCLPRSFCNRKKVMIVTYFLIFITFVTLLCSSYKISDYIIVFQVLLTLLSFLSAFFDTSMEAYRIEYSKNSEIAKFDSLIIIGWSISFTLITSGFLLIANYFGWFYVFSCSTLLSLIFLIFLFFLDELKVSKDDVEELSLDDNKLNFNFKCTDNFQKNTVLKNYYNAFNSFFSKKDVYYVLALTSLFKLSDGILGVLLMPFLLQHGFSKADLGIYFEPVGSLGFIVGTFIGSKVLERFYKHSINIIIISEIFSALSNLLFVLFISFCYGSKLMLFFTSFVEKLCQGFANISIITLMSRFCKKNSTRYTATFFSILSSSSQFTRGIVSIFSGFIVIYCGWYWYFLISCFLSIPAIILCTKLKNFF